MSVNTSVLFDKDYLTTDKPLYTDKDFNTVYCLRAIYIKTIFASALGFYLIRKRLMRTEIKFLQNEFSRIALPLLPTLLLLNNNY